MLFPIEALRLIRVILEKLAGPGRRKYVVFTILVGARSVLLQYLGIDRRPHIQVLSVPIPPEVWCHLAIQVYQRDITVYLDKFQSNRTGIPILTRRLDFPILDQNDEAVVRIGHRVRGDCLLL